MLNLVNLEDDLYFNLLHILLLRFYLSSNFMFLFTHDICSESIDYVDEFPGDEL